jgi:hypothetical protein
MLRTAESFPSFRRFMASFRAEPLDFATEADFGALGRLPRQDYDYFNLHLLAAASLTLARCLIGVLCSRFLLPSTASDCH